MNLKPYIIYIIEENSSISNEQFPENQVYYLSNYPNPFNPETTISYQILNNSNVLLQIFNTKGQLIETLVNKCQNSGMHSVVWDAKNQNSGIYFYRMKSVTQTKIGKCLLLK
jgi:hypothetical protein